MANKKEREIINIFHKNALNSSSCPPNHPVHRPVSHHNSANCSHQTTKGNHHPATLPSGGKPALSGIYRPTGRKQGVFPAHKIETRHPQQPVITILLQEWADAPSNHLREALNTHSVYSGFVEPWPERIFRDSLRAMHVKSSS